MTLRAASGLLVIGVVGWGCAYYNGLYNANRLAADAARAAREGRAGESRALWQQAAVKAESVAARYPRSRYRDDALLLQGRALVEAERCDQAVVPLVFVSDSSSDLANRRRGALLLGRCRVLLGEAGPARATLSPLIADQDAALAREARVWSARAALAQADYAGALSDLTGIGDTSAAFDRAEAMIGLGRTPEATIALARLAPGGYDERRWPGVLETLGAAAPDHAAALVDSLVRRGNLSPGQRARLLLADALRWERSGDKDRFRSRLTEAREIAADSAEGRVAEARLLLADVRGLGDLDRLPDMLTRLNALVIDGGEEGAMVRPVLDVLSRLGRDSQGPTADLEEFLMAETVRDSLRANALAASLFRKLQRDFPRSPLAAKALLAVAVLTPDSAAVIAAMVDSAYPDSPYRLAIRMNDTVAYPALEDSLRLLLDSARRAQADRVQGMMRRPTAGRDSTVSRPATGRRLPEP